MSSLFSRAIFDFRKLKKMGYNEFYTQEFLPKDDHQVNLFEDFKRLRSLFGTPHKFAYLRSLVRTRKFTRTVYPPGWRFK